VWPAQRFLPAFFFAAFIFFAIVCDPSLLLGLTASARSISARGCRLARSLRRSVLLAAEAIDLKEWH
jgi:hypothetical protein